MLVFMRNELSSKISCSTRFVTSSSSFFWKFVASPILVAKLSTLSTWMHKHKVPQKAWRSLQSSLGQLAPPSSIWRKFKATILCEYCSQGKFFRDRLTVTFSFDVATRKIKTSYWVNLFVHVVDTWIVFNCHEGGICESFFFDYCLLVIINHHHSTLTLP